MNTFARRSIAVLALSGLVAGSAFAQFTGPGARGTAARSVARTVAEILARPVDDQKVDLTGRLLEQTGRETFVFADDTGRITVEIDADDFPAQPISPEVRVRILGEVEKDFMRDPRVEVEVLRVVTGTETARPAQPAQPMPPPPAQPAQPAQP